MYIYIYICEKYYNYPINIALLKCVLNSATTSMKSCVPGNTAVSILLGKVITRLDFQSCNIPARILPCSLIYSWENQYDTNPNIYLRHEYIYIYIS